MKVIEKPTDSNVDAGGDPDGDEGLVMDDDGDDEPRKPLKKKKKGKRKKVKSKKNKRDEL